MANKRKHAGIIKHTVPEPKVFYGTNVECAERAGVTPRSMSYLRSGANSITRTGWKLMTEDEYALYYQPPKPVEHKPVVRKNESRKHWRLVILKDWKKGENYPTEPERRFTGTMAEFVKRIGCQRGQVTRMVNTHFGLEEKYPLKSLRGWRIARIRKYDGKEIRTKRVWDKELKKMVYVRKQKV